jgi:hypothetical protein
VALLSSRAFAQAVSRLKGVRLFGYLYNGRQDAPLKRHSLLQLFFQLLDDLFNLPYQISVALRIAVTLEWYEIGRTEGDVPPYWFIIRR